MSREYLQHGRRHGPQGSDPITGLAGGQLALVTGPTFTVGAGLEDYVNPWTFSIQTGGATFALATTTHTDDTVTITGTGLAIVSASALYPGVASRSSAIKIQAGSADTIRHTGIYPAAQFGTAPSAGFADVEDKTVLRVDGSCAIRLQVFNGAAFDDGPQDPRLAIVFITTS